MKYKNTKATKIQKPSCPRRARTAFACKNYCFFWVSLDEELAAGALLEPLAAPPLDGWLDESLEEAELELGEDELGALAEPLVEPPEAESFFVASADEEELEDDGVLGVAPEAALEELESFLVVSTLAEPEVELEPEGAVDGVLVEPADDEDVEPGAVVREAARSPSLSQPVSNPAPSARETATAKVESLMLWASVVGVQTSAASNGPVPLRS